jgi:tetratricopeptide (TPR) repeat protein
VPDHVEREAHELLTALQETGDDLGITRAWQTIHFCHSLRSRYAEGLPFIMQALPPARRCGDPLEEADIFHDLVDSLYAGPTPTSQAITECDRILIEAPRPTNQLWTLSALSALHAMAGDELLARGLVTRTNEMVDELADIVTPYFVTMVRLRQHNAARLLGDDAMIDETVQLMPDEHLITHPMHQVAVAAARAERQGDTASWTQILELTDPTRHPAGRWTAAHVALRVNRANAFAALDRHEEAIATATQAVDLAAPTDALNDHAQALLTLAGLELAVNGAAIALPHAERAIELWQAKENRTMARRGRAMLDDFTPSPRPPGGNSHGHT